MDENTEAGPSYDPATESSTDTRTNDPSAQKRSDRPHPHWVFRRRYSREFDIHRYARQRVGGGCE